MQAIQTLFFLSIQKRMALCAFLLVMILATTYFLPNIYSSSTEESNPSIPIISQSTNTFPRFLLLTK